jgi:hypothetical protein
MLSAHSMLSASSAAVAFTPGGKSFMKKMPGSTAPFGFFDPLGLSPESVEDAKLFREAELTHGRVAMMAAAGFLVQESFHPLFPSIGGPAINQLGQCDLATGLGLLTPIFLSEMLRATKGWVEPNFSTPESQSRTIRMLRENYKPGDLGLDLTGNKPKGEWADATTGPWAEWQNKELNNGRLAMIAVAGMVGQELATGSGIFGA